MTKKDRKEYFKEYRRKHKEERKEYMREYRKKHKSEIKECDRKHHEKYKKEINKKGRKKYNKGRVFYGYNPFALAHSYYELINPESGVFSPTIANSKMSLDTYIAMRGVFDTSIIRSLMKQLYHGSIEIEEINDMISAAGFDMNSEKFKELIKCICSCKSLSGFLQNYNGGEFK